MYVTKQTDKGKLTTVHKFCKIQPVYQNYSRSNNEEKIIIKWKQMKNEMGNAGENNVRTTMMRCWVVC